MSSSELEAIVFPQEEETVKDLSLTTLNTSQDDSIYTQGGIGKNGEKQLKLMFDTIQCLQDILIGYQRKFIDYDALTEDANCGDIKVFAHKIINKLASYDLETHLSNITEDFNKTFNLIYEKMRFMDSAVMRLKEDNERIKSQLKLCKPKDRDRGVESRERSKYLSIGQDIGGTMDDRATDKLKNKVKKLETQVKEYKKANAELSQEIEDGRLRAQKECKKLKKENKELKETNESSILDEIQDLAKEFKKLRKDVTAKELPEETERPMKLDLVKKMDSIISSVTESESQNQRNFDKTFEEVKKTLQELKELKDRSYEHFLEDNAMKEKLDREQNDCQHLLQVKEQEIFELKLKFKDKEMELENNILQVKLNQKNEVEWAEQEINALICKCQQRNYDSNESGYLQDDSNICVHRNNVERRTSNQVEAEPMEVETMSTVVKDNETINDLRDQLLQKEELLKNKNQALDTIKKKFNDSNTRLNECKMENDDLKKNIEMSESKFKTLTEELTTKTNAISTMRDKIMSLSKLGKAAEEVDNLKRQLDQSVVEINKLDGQINTLKAKLKEKSDECEILKKDKTRLDSEMINMKKLNFKKKMEEK